MKGELVQKLLNSKAYIQKEEKKKIKKRKNKRKVKLIGQMFIDPGKVKRVEVNNENIHYYNKIYDKMRSEESKKASLLKQ